MRGDMIAPPRGITMALPAAPTPSLDIEIGPVVAAWCRGLTDGAILTAELPDGSPELGIPTSVTRSGNARKSVVDRRSREECPVDAFIKHPPD